MSTTMTHRRLVSAFIKAGMKVENVPNWHDKDKPSHSWMATNPKTGKCVVWHTQAAFVPARNGKECYYDESNPVTMNTTWCNPETDSMRDLFMDSYYRTIKSSVDALVRG